MGTTVLMYHSLDDSGSPISLSPQVFARQMQILREKSANVIPFKRLVDSFSNGESLPERSVVLTFDDGFENVYRQAFPVLREYGFPATVFLVAGFCGKTNDWPSQPAAIPRMPIMTWEQIREMDRAGIEFGAHTFNHPRLDQVCGSELELEVAHAKVVIEDRLGHAVEHFSYPYGRSDAASSAMVNRHYSGACTTRLGTVSGNSDPLALERVDTCYLKRPRVFKTLGTPVLSTYLNLRRPMRTVASTLLGRAWA